jgi:hypothetical protein
MITAKISRGKMTQTNREIAIKKAAADSSREYLDLTIPYWFSSMARRRQEDLQVSDYVRVRGLDKQFELIDIFPQFGSCRVREVGGETTCLLMPWAYVSPWRQTREKRTSALTQAIGNWLFGGNLVYRLSEPDRMLKQRKIHWDRQTCDVEGSDGTMISDVPWDELEFADGVEFHLPDDE